MEITELKDKARQIRKDLVELIYNAGGGHIGGDLSETDILTALYYRYLRCSPKDATAKDRDRFILSKGHSVEALYCILADRGYFPRSDLKSFSAFGSKYLGHPNNKVAGVEMNTGSLGHGLSLGVGMALAGKMDGLAYRVYVLMGDGELAEGSVWEAAMAAPHYGLKNLIAIIDRNGLQISGSTEEVMAHRDLAAKWQAFGWQAIDLKNGNDMDSICQALDRASTATAPTVIIAHTTKGSGCPSIENKASWHHKLPNAEEYQTLLAEIEGGAGK